MSKDGLLPQLKSGLRREGTVRPMEIIQEIAKFLTTLCSGLFAGAAIYVNLVEHPARIDCGTELAVTEFGPSYRRAAVMQSSLAAIGFVCSILAWLSGAGMRWFVGGILWARLFPSPLWSLCLLTINYWTQHWIKRLQERWNCCAVGTICTL